MKKYIKPLILSLLCFFFIAAGVLLLSIWLANLNPSSVSSSVTSFEKVRPILGGVKLLIYSIIICGLIFYDQFVNLFARGNQNAAIRKWMLDNRFAVTVCGAGVIIFDTFLPKVIG